MESNYYIVKRNYDYLICEFREFPEELVGNIEESEYEVISYMYKLYSAVRRERNDEIFQVTCYLHYQLADFFYQRRDFKNFNYSINLTEETYKYYKESRNPELAWNVLSWMEGTLSNLYREYKEGFERLEYSFIRIRDMKDVLMNDEYKKQFMKDDDRIKEKELKSNIWFELYQEVELNFNKTEVYKILREDILKD